MQIRCTQKLLKELSKSNNQLAEIENTDSLLGSWYANIFTLDRRKTLIFMNERTLLSFIIYGIRKDNIKNFPVVFVNGIERVLAMEGVRQDIIDKILEQHSTIFFTKTHSNSLRGNMNDLVNMYKHIVLYDGGLKHTDLFDVIAQVNRTPQRNIGWRNSVDAMFDILGTTMQ